MMSLTVGVCLRNAILKTVIISCIIYSTYALSLTVENSRDGSDTFIICNSVTMTCKHQSYSGVNVWIFGSENIAECLFSVCEIKVSKSGFTFKFDTQTGIFTLTIDQVKTEHMNKVIECHNGSTTASVTSKSKDTGFESRDYTIVATVITGIDCIVISVVYIILHKKKVESEINNRTNDKHLSICTIIQKNICAVMCCNGNKNDRRIFVAVFWAAAIIGFIATTVQVLLTRFDKDRVIESYDGICCWGILLSIEGFLLFLIIVLLVIRIRVLCCCPKAPASGKLQDIKMNLGEARRRNVFEEELHTDSDTQTDVNLVIERAPANHDLPLVNMDIKTDDRNIDICFSLAKYNPNVLTTVCFNIDGIVTDITEEQNNTESNKFAVPGTEQILSSMATHFKFPRWIIEDKATCKKLVSLKRCHFKVERASMKTKFAVFVFWTTKEYTFVANSGDKDFATVINTENKFNTDIGPKHWIHDYQTRF